MHGQGGALAKEVKETNKTKKKRRRKKKAWLPQPTCQPNLLTKQQPQRPISSSGLEAGGKRREGRSRSPPISLTRLPARRTRRLRRAVRLSPSVSPSSLSLCPLIARRRWCREPCAGAGGGRGAAGGGAGRSAAWAASGGRRVASRVVLAP
jgi:hypothetical protein